MAAALLMVTSVVLIMILRVSWRWQFDSGTSQPGQVGVVRVRGLLVGGQATVASPLLHILNDRQCIAPWDQKGGAEAGPSVRGQGPPASQAATRRRRKISTPCWPPADARARHRRRTVGAARPIHPPAGSGWYVWSGTGRSRPSTRMTEPTNSSVWRSARQSVSAVRMASGEYQGRPPRLVRGAARHAAIASSVNPTVSSRAGADPLRRLANLSAGASGSGCNCGTWRWP
jgi:hypothetical protein